MRDCPQPNLEAMAKTTMGARKPRIATKDSFKLKHGPPKTTMTPTELPHYTSIIGHIFLQGVLVQGLVDPAPPSCVSVPTPTRGTKTYGDLCSLMWVP